MAKTYWAMESDQFGNPDVGVTQTQSNQFLRGPGDLGIGQYRTYNPTGPIPVGLSWSWDGYTYDAFREAWEDPTKLNFGANWFLLDMALYAGLETTVDGSVSFEVTAGASGTVASGFSSGTTGALDPGIGWYEPIDQLYLNTSDKLVLRLQERRHIVGAQAVRIVIAGYGEQLIAHYDGVDDRYEVDVSTGLKNYLIGQVGSTFWASVIPLPETRALTRLDVALRSNGGSVVSGYKRGDVGSCSPDSIQRTAVDQVALNNYDKIIVDPEVGHVFGASGAVDGLMMQVPDFGPDVFKMYYDFASNQQRYEYNVAGHPLRDYFINNLNRNIDVLISVPVPVLQRYITHFVDPFTAEYIGYNYWKVTAQLEVDLSPQLVV